MSETKRSLSEWVVPEYALVSRRAFRVVAGITVVVIAISAVAVTVTDPDRFPTIWEGLWWACTTVTTVGYGDVVPRSGAGRMVGIALMFTGIALVSILTASIASAMLAENVGQEERHIDEELAAMIEALRRIEARLDGLDPPRS